jgi:hypothetical protein
MFISKKKLRSLENQIDTNATMLQAVAVVLGVDPALVAQKMNDKRESNKFLLELARELKRQLYIGASIKGTRLPPAVEAEMEAMFSQVEKLVELHGPTDAKSG